MASDQADMYIDDDYAGHDDGDDDDSVSDLELFTNRNNKREKRFIARVTKTSTAKMRSTASTFASSSPFLLANYNNNNNRNDNISFGSQAGIGHGKRSMSVCSLSSVGSSSLDGSGSGQAWSWADDDDFKTVAQIERSALHNDIRRNSFRSRNGTSHFVMNPLYHDDDGDGHNDESHKS